jgi:hypothetical protein
MTAMDSRITNQTTTVYQNSTYPNYLGPLFVLGANQTPFLTMMGGLRGYKPAPGFEFAMEQYASLEAASQAVVGEDDSVTGSAGLHSYTKAQGTNTCQIMYRNIAVSYAKASSRAQISGVTYSTPQEFMQAELDFQTEMALKQLAVDMEFSCLQGTYQTKTDATTHAATGGFGPTLETAALNVVDAGTSGQDAAALTKAMIDTCSKKMADAGAPMTNMVIFGGSFQIQALSDLYGWAPVGGAGAGLGGVRVNRLLTQFFEADVVFAPHMRTDDLLMIDMDKCQLRGLEVPGKGAVFVEPKGKTGASELYQLYAQLGFDYGDASFHGLIYDLDNA